MDNKFINKHKNGMIAFLFVILFISQKSSFRFLTHTIIGRLSLIVLLLGISNSTPVLGIVAVLIVVIMINQDNSFYLEGFDNIMTNSIVAASHKEGLTNEKEKKEKKQNNIIEPETIQSTEGHNVYEKERNIQQGLESNAIGIGHMNSNAAVEPSSGSYTSVPESFL
jgi:hypothetical protein